MNIKIVYGFLLSISLPSLATDYWYKGWAYYAGRADQAREDYERLYRNKDSYQENLYQKEKRFADIYLAKRNERARYQKVYVDNVTQDSGYALGRLAEFVKKEGEDVSYFLTLLDNARSAAKNATEKRAPDLVLSQFPQWLQVAVNYGKGPDTFYSERDVNEYGNAQAAAIAFKLVGVDRHANVIHTIKKTAVVDACVRNGLRMDAPTSDGFTVMQRLLEQRTKNPAWAWIFDRFFKIVLQDHVIKAHQSVTSRQEILPKQVDAQREKNSLDSLHYGYCIEFYDQTICERVKKMMESVNDLVWLEEMIQPGYMAKNN